MNAETSSTLVEDNEVSRRDWVALLGTIGTAFGVSSIVGCGNSGVSEEPSTVLAAISKASGSAFLWVDSIAGPGTNLRSIVGTDIGDGGTNNSSKPVIVVGGYYSPADGGGGVFYWDTSASTGDDGGVTIVPTGSSSGRWARLYSGALNVLWFGLVGDGSSNPVDGGLDGGGTTSNDQAWSRLFNYVSALQLLTLDGVYPAGIQIFFPRGRYIFTSSVRVPPYCTLLGEGQLSVLEFQMDSTGPYQGDGIVANYFLDNVSRHVRIRDISIYNKNSANTKGAGIDFIMGADGTVERVFIEGFKYGVICDGSDTITLREIYFGGSTSWGYTGLDSVGIWLAYGPTHGAGNTSSYATNQIRIENCAFNGPHINVWHEDGVGHFVRGCNSEGGILGKFGGGSGTRTVVHEGWTQEGQQGGSLFYFWNPSMAVNYVGWGVEIRNCYFQGSSTNPLVLLDPQAYVTHFQWHNNIGVGWLSSGAITGGARFVNTCIVSGPFGGRLFDATPATMSILDLQLTTQLLNSTTWAPSSGAAFTSVQIYLPGAVPGNTVSVAYSGIAVSTPGSYLLSGLVRQNNYVEVTLARLDGNIPSGLSGTLRALVFQSQ
jgi:hypothetical protein